MAHKALDGVGDASLGEWVEDRGRYTHLRRRLSTDEQKITGEAVDIRADQAEVDRRLSPVRRFLPAGYKE